MFRQIILNFSLVILSAFVFFLSVGVSISKMYCSLDGKIFFGKEVPNCMTENDISCDENLVIFSCCDVEVISESCCPQTNDNSCASETKNIQFDFVTYLTAFEFEVFKDFYILLLTHFFENVQDDIKKHPFVVPLIEIRKPILSKIQSFIL